MQCIRTLAAWHAFRSACLPQKRIGFVPTMGALHVGHTSLIKTSLAENEMTVVSVFVNPTQFNEASDFTHYPRTEQTDIDLLANLGVDACFIPDASAIYSDTFQFQIVEQSLSQCMEGLSRPGHFSGVLTVVMKLFNIIKPTTAYFGEKDYQQFQLIKRMADAFFMGIDVKACPTIREPSGLAYSSRNQRLTAEQHALAGEFARIFHQPLPLDTIEAQLKAVNIPVDYLEEHERRRFIAVTIGSVRLIDNYSVDAT